MKHLFAATFIALAAAGALAAPAPAADLTYPIRMPLAPPAPVMSWTGFYIGGAVGSSFGSTPFNVEEFGYTTNVGDYGSSSFSAGLYLGYNWQVATSWVLGLEGEANWLNQSFNSNIGENGNFLNSDWQFAISARGGYLLTPSTLLFAKVGWAFTDASIDNIYTLPGLTYSDGYRNGVLVGLGIETLIANNWLVRLEGDYTINTQNASIGFPDAGAAIQFAPDYLTARLGIGYKF
ncbi:outer membrane beta-barrel protein [Xanthobacter sp. DSM 14520]|uniref:outer membrane protein n=1 Tax=Xanthobacter autotrophicus (strain ATCC BAA-1158 / Py2) TaxID=78245 RepID=UPI00372788BE